MNSNKGNSGISAAIHDSMASFCQNQQLLENTKSKEYSIKVANTLDERAAVFRAGYQIYLNKGFIKPNPQNWMIKTFDFDEDTLILIVQDKHKNLAGSVTLVFDGCSRLPAEKIYGNEIKKLRNSGERLVELSRLVISPEYRNSKEILILLFNYLSIYSLHSKNYTSLVIEVNPRHKEYYKKLLGFEEIGEEKSCPIVQNAPAVLLHLPLQKYQSEIKRCHELSHENKRERTLYSFFLKPEQENLVAFYLQKQAAPMSLEEKQYFGFSDTNLKMTAVV